MKLDCPKCGLVAQVDQRFCRSCGTEIETGLAVASDSAGLAIFEAESRSGYAMGGIAIFLIGGALSAMGGILLGNKTVVFAGILTMFIGMFLIAYSSFPPSRRKRHISAARTGTDLPHDDEPGFRADTTKRLIDPIINGIPSVVEDTTDLLKVPAATRTKAPRR